MTHKAYANEKPMAHDLNSTQKYMAHVPGRRQMMRFNGKKISEVTQEQTPIQP